MRTLSETPKKRLPLRKRIRRSARSAKPAASIEPVRRRRQSTGKRQCRRGALVAALFVVACSDDGQRSSATLDDEPEPVVVLAEEYRFVPATLSTLRTPVVRLDNVGALAHTWNVIAEPVESEFEITLGATLAAAHTDPGQSATVDLAGLAPGTYQIVCAIPGHFSLGMIGELVLRED
jgi:plastocyanin